MARLNLPCQILPPAANPRERRRSITASGSTQMAERSFTSTGRACRHRSSPIQPAGSIQLLKLPLRSLKRSSRPGGRISGLRPAKACAALVDEIGATLAVVSDDELPHNSCTAGETGCVRSPAWYIERKTGSVGCG